VPTFNDGGIALCHAHQRALLLHGGMTEYLIELTRRVALDKRHNSICCPFCKRTTRIYRLGTPKEGQSQYRHLCGNCNRRWGLVKKGSPLTAEVRQEMDRRIRAGETPARISRTLRVHKNTVAKRMIRMVDHS
jgi:transposase-like protein